METLFNWISGAANKLFAITGTKLYDVTDPTSVTEATGVGAVTEGRWRSCQHERTGNPGQRDRRTATGSTAPEHGVAHGFTALPG